jgi:hypothetical protein
VGFVARFGAELAQIGQARLLASMPVAGSA